MCTGPQWKQSGPDRDSPLGYLIASGIFVATYRAVPVALYLGAVAVLLKGVGKRFDAFGQFLGTFYQRRIEHGWKIDFPPIDDLVSEQQRCKQQLARFGE